MLYPYLDNDKEKKNKSKCEYINGLLLHQVFPTFSSHYLIYSVSSQKFDTFFTISFINSLNMKFCAVLLLAVFSARAQAIECAGVGSVCIERHFLLMREANVAVD